MDNQHQKIAGYRDLSQGDIDMMNAIKQQEADLGLMLANIETLAHRAGDKEAGRWASIARTHLETGMMFAVKAVGRPTNGLGRKVEG